MWKPCKCMCVCARAWFRVECVADPTPEIHRWFATRATIYRSLRALRAQKRKKVSKRVFLGVREKVPENIRKCHKIPLEVQSLGIWGFFRVFSGTFLRTPKKTLFEIFFCDFGPRGPGVNGRSGRNRWSRMERAWASADHREWELNP